MRMNSIEQKGIITMYKKDSCPYCKKAKATLEEKYSLKVTYVDIGRYNLSLSPTHTYIHTHLSPFLSLPHFQFIQRLLNQLYEMCIF